ncbi:DNA repair protein rad16 [Choanephora cucurbitarum]|uniref:DNA repair protein rad16 n=1 Tax=Choanephora cucurbitarum TaxID=101091 RepID=A0A1C7NI27_9FUNG|nr:DNA repair protein rad16 [Choanephora cucurbitarum]
MLEFQKQILTEIVTEDGLLIISPGLGLFQIVCSLVQIYTGGNHLVLLINSTKEQDELIQEQLAAHGVPFEHGLRRIEYNTPAEKRSSMYRESGIFSVTSRILAVDMLLNRLPVTLVNGVIVHNAHRVRPNSMEELILRIYREHNKEGFLKALTDKPDAFSSGFAPLQSMMKSLFLRKTHLWPRFQVTVTENLAQSDGHVVELRQPMTEAMETIQQNLVQCMEETLQELRRANPTLDFEDFTIENSFFKSFDALVRRQLDPIWHRVSAGSKQLVGDLKVLRQLLSYLTTYDCVSFYSFIETIIAANTSIENKQVKQSQWLFLESGSKAIQTARKRVYVKYGDPEYDSIEATQQHPDIPSHIKLVLEEQPKWDLLKDILKEIEHESLGLEQGEGASVLIMVSERRTCSQLKDYITRFQQESPFLDKIAHNFFRWRALMHRMQHNQTEQIKTNQPPSQASAYRGRPPPNKRRRMRGGSMAASGPDRSQTLAETFKDDVIDTLSVLDTNDPEEDEDETAFQGVGPLTDAYEIKASNDDILPSFEEIPKTSLITIQCYEDDISHQILEDTQPRFIIMFDPHPAFIRQVEVYRALHPSIEIKVYFMLYENSVEEQNYLSLIKKEKESFERLIHEKSIMTIPLPEQRKVQEELIVRNNTRIAGGQEIKVSEGPATVIVDLREFRSSLPPILYAEGIQIVPCTLQVGDYILSPDMCVERKSIADLIQSFSSGRLYTQCESMSLYYTMPILLIEFDQNKSFSLQAVSEMKENIRMTDLSSKLVMLALAFPKLRIIWSSSPHETAKIFSELKKTEKEPNAETATAIGAEGTENGDTVYNMTPQEILRSMPGVTSANYKLIMNQVKDLEELLHLSKRKIQGIIGEELGNKLYNFIHKK